MRRLVTLGALTDLLDWIFASLAVTLGKLQGHVMQQPQEGWLKQTPLKDQVAQTRKKSQHSCRRCPPPRPGMQGQILMLLQRQKGCNNKDGCSNGCNKDGYSKDGCSKDGCLCPPRPPGATSLWTSHCKTQHSGLPDQNPISIQIDQD